MVDGHEGEKRVWISDKAHAMLAKMSSRYKRPYKSQLDWIVKEAYDAVRAKDKAKRERKRKAKR